jgi:hypothetical protein
MHFIKVVISDDTYARCYISARNQAQVYRQQKFYGLALDYARAAADLRAAALKGSWEQKAGGFQA